MRAQLRERMQRQQGPAVDAVREFYNKHALADSGAMLSQYIWFALVAGPSPKFALTLKRDELPPEVISLEGFNEVLSAYYQEQKIGALWRSMQPVYNREIDELHESVSQIIFVATNYLRELVESGQSADIYDHRGAAGGANYERAQFGRPLLDRAERSERRAGGRGAPRVPALPAGPAAPAVSARRCGEEAGVRCSDACAEAGARLEG